MTYVKQAGGYFCRHGDKNAKLESVSARGSTAEFDAFGLDSVHVV